MLSSTPGFSGERRELDSAFKAAPAEESPKGLLLGLSPPVVKATHTLALTTFTQAEDHEESKSPVDKTEKDFTLVVSPRSSRKEVLTQLFMRTLPSSVRDNWSREGLFFPSFHQNQFLLFHKTSSSQDRPKYKIHPDIRSDIAARETLSSLFKDNDTPLWTALISVVDTTLAQLFDSSHTYIPNLREPPDFSDLEGVALTEAQTEYEQHRQKWGQQTADDYKAHIALRVKLAILQAIVFHNRGPDITFTALGRTSAQIGDLVLDMQGAHHSIAPNIETVSVKERMGFHAKKIDLDSCIMQLESSPSFADREARDTPVEEQVHRLRSLLASGVDFSDLVEAYELDESAREEGPREEGLDTATISKVSDLVSTHTPESFIHEQTLTFIMNNFVHPTEKFLNEFDKVIEDDLRLQLALVTPKGMASPNPIFAKLVNNEYSLSEYAKLLKDRLCHKVETVCEVLTTLNTPAEGETETLLSKTQKWGEQFQDTLLEAISLLQKVESKLDSASFPEDAAIKELIKTFNLQVAELDELKKLWVIDADASRVSYFKYANINKFHNKLKTVIKDLTERNRSWAANKTGFMEKVFPKLADETERRDLPSLPNPRTTIKDPSLLSRLSSMLDEIRITRNNLLAIPFLSEGIGKFVEDEINSVLQPYLALRPDQKHYFQHMLSAKLFPPLPTDPTSTPALSIPEKPVRVEVVDDTTTAPIPLDSGDSTHDTAPVSLDSGDSTSIPALSTPEKLGRVEIVNDTTTAPIPLDSGDASDDTAPTTPPKPRDDLDGILGGDDS